ncbi:MAG: glycosyltransferase family A protein [Xanthobacteraceae bacterium]
MDDILISLIVPTRGRPAGMLAFLESVHANASFPQNIEAVMVVDEDDLESQAITFEGLRLVKVVVPPDLTMGALHTAGYRASRGKYIMLANDDVRVRTDAWDEQTLAAFRSFPDDIVLVHVNDMEQQQKLCVLPFVSRRFCDLSNGICPEEYMRYYIDDHVYDVFELLAKHGHDRIVYLSGVVFEHLNVVIDPAGKRLYQYNSKIQAQDATLFHEMAPARVALAARLAAWIEVERRSRTAVERRGAPLAQHVIAAAARRPKFRRFISEGNPILQRMPPFVEREIGRLFCIFGFSRIGTSLWNSACSRKAREKPQPVLVDPARWGFGVFLYDHKYFFVSADKLAALGGELPLEQCRSGAIPNVTVVNSLAEASALIARMKEKAAAAGDWAG